MSEFNLANKDRWHWTMMISQPDPVTPDIVDTVKLKAFKKKGNILINEARLDQYIEGLAVQILYTGPYANEAPVITEMHQFILSNGYQTHGKHHEIYQGESRKTSPERLRTILRQPIIKI